MSQKEEASTTEIEIGDPVKFFCSKHGIVDGGKIIRIYSGVDGMGVSYVESVLIERCGMVYELSLCKLHAPTEYTRQ